MLKDRFKRHALAFLILVSASTALYLAARSGSTAVLWGLMGLNIMAALLVLLTP